MYKHTQKQTHSFLFNAIGCLCDYESNAVVVVTFAAVAAAIVIVVIVVVDSFMRTMRFELKLESRKWRELGNLFL